MTNSGNLKSRPDITLQAHEQDALRELVNIGFGRAASSLSLLVSQRVLLDTPQVHIYPLDRLTEGLTALVDKELINVHQVFRGALSGNAILLMDQDSAAVLVDMINGGPGAPRSLDTADREALVEIGNIVVNAFIGSFGNLLKVHLTFTVPDLRVESLSEMMHMLSVDGRNLMYALVVEIAFHLSQGEVNGYVVVIMGIDSLDALLAAMKAENFL